MANDWKWLASTKKLQTFTYHYDYDEFRRGHLLSVQDRRTKSGLTQYLDWNVTAAVQELAEVREEFSWKPWARDIAFYNRDRIRDEVIDVMHFLGNILTAIDVDDRELEIAYQRKQHVNQLRADSGNYSARKGGLSEGSDIT